jgi:hypothetical protein
MGGKRSNFPLPHHRLTGRDGETSRARFGRDPDIRWRGWDDEATWRVSAAWVQHGVARDLWAVIAGEAQPACQLALGDTEDERTAAVAGFCDMTERRLDELLKGWMPIRTHELLAWLAVTGVDSFPVEVEGLLPEKGLTNSRPGGDTVRRMKAAKRKSRESASDPWVNQDSMD